MPFYLQKHTAWSSNVNKGPICIYICHSFPFIKFINFCQDSCCSCQDLWQVSTHEPKSPPAQTPSPTWTPTRLRFMGERILFICILWLSLFSYFSSRLCSIINILPGKAKAKLQLQGENIVRAAGKVRIRSFKSK